MLGENFKLGQFLVMLEGKEAFGNRKRVHCSLMGSPGHPDLSPANLWKASKSFLFWNVQERILRKNSER
jgi:hypothetical protein